MAVGAGPAADAVYFPAVYAVGGPKIAPNAMWLTVLFDFGEWGLAIFVAMLLVGVWRMRRNSLALAVFLPFFTASMVNSAIPDYSVTALGILLFSFGWLVRPSFGRFGWLAHGSPCPVGEVPGRPTVHPVNAQVMEP